MKAKYINPFTDFGFKKLFGEEVNKELLIDTPPKLRDRIFEKAFSIAEIARFDPQQVQAYESSLKYYRDLKNVIDTSFEEGKLEGKLEGIQEGVYEGKLEVALQMKKSGFSIDEIARLTGLSPEDIRIL
ncbi:MAG: hypothetical protein EAZ89_03620 [Bacteroidetes bacterium]|nr:MAG: hypothetical protein EAZ89_03620 [Bacteroidota bacterium]